MVEPQLSITSGWEEKTVHQSIHPSIHLSIHPSSQLSICSTNIGHLVFERQSNNTSFRFFGHSVSSTLCLLCLFNLLNDTVRWYYGHFTCEEAVTQRGKETSQLVSGEQRFESSLPASEFMLPTPLLVCFLQVAPVLSSLHLAKCYPCS